MTGTTNTRNQAIDMVKLIASFLVISIHTKTTSSIDGFKPGSFSFIIDNIARFAVPFFFIATAYFTDFADRKKLMQRLLKVTLLYIFWSAIFIVVRETNGVNYPSFPFSYNELASRYLNILYTVFFYGLERHMWFFSAYIVGVLMVLYFRKNKTILILSATILYCIGLSGQEFRFIYPEDISFIPMKAYDYEWLQKPYLTRNGFFLAFPCMAIGYLLKEATEKLKRIPSAVIIIVIILLFILQYFELICMTAHTDYPAEYYTVTIFIATLILIYCIKNSGKETALSKAGKYAGGIYLLHPLFMYLLMLKFKVWTTLPAWPFIYTPLLFVLSYISAVCISRIPFLKKTIVF